MYFLRDLFSSLIAIYVLVTLHEWIEQVANKDFFSTKDAFSCLNLFVVASHESWNKYKSVLLDRCQTRISLCAVRKVFNVTHSSIQIEFYTIDLISIVRAKRFNFPYFLIFFDTMNSSTILHFFSLTKRIKNTTQLHKVISAICFGNASKSKLYPSLRASFKDLLWESYKTM